MRVRDRPRTTWVKGDWLLIWALMRSVFGFHNSELRSTPLFGNGTPSMRNFGWVAGRTSTRKPLWQKNWALPRARCLNVCYLPNSMALRPFARFIRLCCGAILPFHERRGDLCGTFVGAPSRKPIPGGLEGRIAEYPSISISGTVFSWIDPWPACGIGHGFIAFPLGLAGGMDYPCVDRWCQILLRTSRGFLRLWLISCFI